jgi:hypothetical protein
MSASGRGSIGRYMRGFWDARDIPRKVIVAKSRIHESTLSRKITGAEEFQEEELFRIGVATGLAMKDPTDVG